MQARYELLRYKTPADRLTCPACGKHHSLAPYVDLQTGQIIDEGCGKCNRADNCGYHLPPREFFAQHPDRKPVASDYAKPLPPVDEKRLMYLPVDTIAPCFAERFRIKNNFWLYLQPRFGEAMANQAFDSYRLGTSNHYGGGSTVFPLYDGTGYASAQIIKVDALTGKTVRFSEGRATTWLHKVTDCGTDYSERAEKYPFPFGLHLALAEPQKTVCVVESAKTAVVQSIEYPDFAWLAVGALSWLNILSAFLSMSKRGLAVGALSWLNPQRLDALKGRDILLIPDGGAGEREWTQKAGLFQRKGFRVETVSFNLPDGADIADLVFDQSENKIVSFQTPKPGTSPEGRTEPEPVGGMLVINGHRFAWQVRQQPYELEMFSNGKSVAHKQ
jgi:Domain of unknown function (DUF6371)